jgi:hypothetical protein
MIYNCNTGALTSLPKIYTLINELASNDELFGT